MYKKRIINLEIKIILINIFSMKWKLECNSNLIALKIGYNGYQPINETYQLLTSIEAIIGAFFWAVAIIIFGKKFMR